MPELFCIKYPPLDLKEALPDLIVDGIELLLQHAGQRLSVSVTGWGQDISENALRVLAVLGVAAFVASLPEVTSPIVLDDLRTRDDWGLD